MLGRGGEAAMLVEAIFVTTWDHVGSHHHQTGSHQVVVVVSVLQWR